MRNILNNKRPYFLLALLVFAAACANVVAPTGGPIDEDPPVVLRSTPPNYSTNFTGEDVRIFFDEFVELDNLRQNMLVSPPLQSDPEVRVRRRSIIMSIEDTLAPNTTYNFFFGESIVDITEGNAIPNFQYVVSTGDYVDSLSIAGRVRDAYTLEPADEVFVMLYDDIYDSVPMLELPVYLSKTNEEGEFFISNMREGEYLMFALMDKSSNFKYDSREEKIAFLDSLVSPKFAGHIHLFHSGDETPENDNGTVNDTINGNDIPINDTIPEESFTLPIHDLYLFQEKDTFQRILSARLERPGKVNIEFRIPTDSVHVREYRTLENNDWYIPELGAYKDTLTLWIPKMKELGTDSLFLEVMDRDEIIDTAKVALVRRATRGRERERDEDDEIAPISLLPTTLTRNTQPYYTWFRMRSPTPLAEFRQDLTAFFVSDSIPLTPEFSFTDQVQRRLKLDNTLEPDSSYRLILLPGAATDIFGATNDTLTFTFNTNNPADYATVLANIELPDDGGEQYILQLLDSDLETIHGEKIIADDDIYRFEHLAARTFRLRLIKDRNKNGKWDTGNYLKGIQPERVYMFSDDIEGRLNWEVEVIWSIEQY